MSKLIKYSLKILPSFIKIPLIRSQIKIVPEMGNPDIRVLVAENKVDFETAFGLLHASYVASGLMDPHSSGLRCNSYSFLPHTTIIILKIKDKVIGTVSLIRDSAMGLPSDEKYKLENDSLRKNGKVLTEVSALAIDKDFRNHGHALSLLLMKFLFTYSKEHSDTEFLVCTIHPRAQDFYKALFGFKKKGKTVSYEYVKGALAVYMFMEVSDQHTKKLVENYHSKDPERNLSLYCLREDKRFKYPAYKNGQILDVRMTPELLNYFFNERTELFKNLSEDHRKMFYEIYYYHFGKKIIDVYFPQMIEQKIREYRVPTKLSAVISHKEDLIKCLILDISPNGCFVAFSEYQKILQNDDVQIKFQLGENEFILEGTSTWRNKGINKRYPEGVGIKFNASILQLSSELKKWKKQNEEQAEKAA